MPAASTARNHTQAAHCLVLRTDHMTAVVVVADRHNLVVDKVVAVDTAAAVENIVHCCSSVQNYSWIRLRCLFVVVVQMTMVTKMHHHRCCRRCCHCHYC